MKTKIANDIKRRGMTRKQYAELMGVSLESVYKWLRGETEPRPQILMLMDMETADIPKRSGTPRYEVFGWWVWDDCPDGGYFIKDDGGSELEYARPEPKNAMKLYRGVT